MLLPSSLTYLYSVHPRLRFVPESCSSGRFMVSILDLASYLRLAKGLRCMRRMRGHAEIPWLEKAFSWAGSVCPCHLPVPHLIDIPIATSSSSSTLSWVFNYRSQSDCQLLDLFPEKLKGH